MGNNNKNMTELTAGKISITTEITETTQSIKNESRILTMQKSKTGHNKKKTIVLLYLFVNIKKVISFK